jgi:RNA polymerase sigma-70 factor (sigma-E family)
VLDAFDDYVRGRGNQLLRTAYLLTGDPQIAEDVVQNALASVLASWRRLRDVADLDAYVYTALVNARGRWWRRRWHGEVPAEFLPDAPTADETGRDDSYDAMVTALRRVPARQRAALVLRYYEDLSEEQTAAVLGCSVGTVKSQTARGLVRLREALVAGADERPAGPTPPPAAAPPTTPPVRPARSTR